MDRSQIRGKIKEFLEAEFQYVGEEISDTLNLAENVYLDSINAVRVVLYLEEHFLIQFSGGDLNPKNFFHLGSLTDLVYNKIHTEKSSP